ncbi:MAG: hypothetical protein GXO86_14480 [Chlorobi bacterium]|nr:hypothetical protein [Chlorobiota bacterium]
MNRIIYILIVGFAVLVNSCRLQETKNGMTKSERLALFDQVWNNVNEQFYDPDFNGVDWQANYDKYKPRIENCTQTDSLFILLNTMLFDLNSSHCGVGMISEMEKNVSPYLFAEGTIGIDIRILDDEMIITKVIHESVAALSGLKPGYLIQKIDGLSLDDFRKSTIYKPPFNDRNKKFHLTTEVLMHIYGKPGTGERQ